MSILSVSGAAHSAEASQPRRAWSDEDAFILLKGGSESTMMRGSTADLSEARRLRSGGEPLLYVRRNATSYVIRDAAMLRQADAITRPQAELGKKQGALGSQQGALGARQAALGQRQAAITLRHVSGGRTHQAALDQGALARQQAELGRQQAVLGEEQARLGRQQERLGREAEAKLRALVDEALRRGLAQRIG